MKNNQDLVLLSAVIITAFVIFIINRIRFKKKKKKRHDANDQEIIRKSVINTLADMESDGVYFPNNQMLRAQPYDKPNAHDKYVSEQYLNTIKKKLLKINAKNKYKN